MQQVLRRRVEEFRPPADLPEAAAPGAGESTAPAAAMQSPPIVNVIWGPMTDNMTVAGMTVGNVRTLLQAPFNIPATAPALVNGFRVSARHRLAPGDTLEFTHPPGEKGAVG